MEQLLEDGAGMAERTKVFVDELAGTAGCASKTCSASRHTGSARPTGAPGTEHPHEASEFNALAWHLIGRPTAHDHQPVAYPARQRPRRDQGFRVTVGDQAGAAGNVERGKRTGCAQAFDPVPMAQLKQLHGPFDVGQRAAAELRVHGRIRTAWQPLSVHPYLDAANLHDLRRRQAAVRIADAVGEGEETLREIRVAGYVPGA